MIKDRAFSCWSCKYRGASALGSDGRPYKVRCTITHRLGLLSRGYTCLNFEYSGLDGALGADGIPIKNRQSLDYRTANQWLEEGRLVKDGEVGKEMHPSRMSMRVYEYYLIEQTEVINKC